MAFYTGMVRPPALGSDFGSRSGQAGAIQGTDEGGSTVHASCVVVGADGVLIRGASGSGKSTLALELIARAECAGRFGRLVSDDRTILDAKAGRLIAMAPSALAGLIEVRGLGLLRRPALPAVVVRLVVDLVAAPQRLPEDGERRTELGGVVLPRLAVTARSAASAMVVSQALQARHSALQCG